MSDLRITSGRFKGRALISPEGEEVTRPLLTRLRKSLADILRPRLQGARVLELFGGTGAIAFELLSNGAATATIIEKDPVSARIIRENARKLGAEAKVVEGDCLQKIPQLAAQGEKFDIIIVAPPYGLGLQKKAMGALSSNPLLLPGGLAIVQREKIEPLWEPVGLFTFAQTRAYGRTVFDFYDGPA